MNETLFAHRNLISASAWVGCDATEQPKPYEAPVE